MNLSFFLPSVRYLPKKPGLLWNLWRRKGPWVIKKIIPKLGRSGESPQAALEIVANPYLETTPRENRLLREQHVRFLEFEKNIVEAGKEFTIVVLPALNFDHEFLKNIKNFKHYEARMLWVISLIRQYPMGRIKFLCSFHPDETILEVWEKAFELPNLRERLEIHVFEQSEYCESLDCHILSNRKKLKIFKKHLQSESSILMPFVCSEEVRTLGRYFNIPILGLHNSLYRLNTKIGNRHLFHEAEVPIPAGKIIDSDRSMIQRDRMIRSLLQLLEEGKTEFVLKLNDGVSGFGNARLSLSEWSTQTFFSFEERYCYVDQNLDQLQLQAGTLTVQEFLDMGTRQGILVEEFIVGLNKTSPSYQAMIDCEGKVRCLSSHEQILEGATYLGAIFPASERYRRELRLYTEKIGAVLARRGVRGRFSVDFLASESAAGETSLHTIEINIRLGGTTHGYELVKAAVQGEFDASSGLLLSGNSGTPVYYQSMDNLYEEKFIGLSPVEFVQKCQEYLYDPKREKGMLIHFLESLTKYGKFGATFVGNSPQEVTALFEDFRQFMQRC